MPYQYELDEAVVPILDVLADALTDRAVSVTRGPVAVGDDRGTVDGWLVDIDGVPDSGDVCVGPRYGIIPIEGDGFLDCWIGSTLLGLLDESAVDDLREVVPLCDGG